MPRIELPDDPVGRIKMHQAMLSHVQKIDHEILQEGDIIKEIRISNIDEDARVRELRSSIRWTFERMIEKRTA